MSPAPWYWCLVDPDAILADFESRTAKAAFRLRLFTKVGEVVEESWESNPTLCVTVVEAVGKALGGKHFMDGITVEFFLSLTHFLLFSRFVLFSPLFFFLSIFSLCFRGFLFLRCAVIVFLFLSPSTIVVACRAGRRFGDPSQFAGAIPPDAVRHSYLSRYPLFCSVA